VPEPPVIGLKVELWPIGRLIEYARNPRKNDDQVDRMAGAIAEFGFRIPIVAKSDGLIIDGHLRLKAAKKLGATHVPVALADELTDAQVKAFRLLANRSSTWADWDKDLLTIELLDLDGMGFDLELTGFDPDELSFYTGTAPSGSGADPDDIPETPVHPVTRPGDVWILGRHRLAVGDSTDPATVRLLLNGVQPHLMTTDPPYGVDYDPVDRGKARNADGKLLSTGMKRAVGKVQNDDVADWKAAYEHFPGDVAYVWHAAINPGVAQKNLEDAGFEIRMQIIWAKSNFVVSRGHYHMQHEPCFYCVRRNKTAHWAGDRKQSTLWQIDKAPKNMTGHSTEKPVECMLRPIENNSSVGQAVYDPFVGSGTTVIACEMSGRACYAIELNPAFVDVAVKRWQNFTLGAAVLEQTGKTFEEMAMERPFCDQLPLRSR
jgi:DNA modification methylase